jgi:hypothetical protein
LSHGAATAVVERDGDGTRAGEQRDLADTAKRCEDERSAEHGVTGERKLGARSEDAYAVVREHEGRLGEADLAREQLHQSVVDTGRVREHRELITGQRCVGEDIGDGAVE